MQFSIVIANYNYGRFVGQAIDSALAIDWPDKEVIVVDDGSTDDSRSVIESFRHRVTSIFTPNAGQARAYNLGFEQASGTLVIFLDADDLLLPSVARDVAAVWRPSVSKVQYGMIYVDESLRPLGRCWPVYTEKHTPEWAARSMKHTGAYLGSLLASAWSRSFLNEVFPVPTLEQGLHSIDIYLQTLAPFFGSVVSLSKPQYIYRQHGHNHSGSRSVGRYIFLANQADTTYRLSEQFLQRKNLPSQISRNNEYNARVFLVVKRFFPTHYRETVTWLLWRYWKALWHAELNSVKKLILLAWSLAIIAMPTPIAGWLVLMRDGHTRLRSRSIDRPPPGASSSKGIAVDIREPAG